jgi:hypothetical protein
VKPREALLERRRQYLQAKIAAQRAQLAWQLSEFERPLHAFEVARNVGEKIRRHAPMVGMAAAMLGFSFMRGGIFRKTFRTVQIAQKTTRWWAVARLGLQLAQRWRAYSAHHAH